MRTLVLLLALGLGLFSGRFTADCQAQPQVVLAWNAETNNPFVAGYYLAWGTNNGVFIGTNIYPGNQTTGIITNLAYGLEYYIAVAAYATNFETNPIGPFCTPITYVTNAPGVIFASGGSGSPPPPPPGPGRSAPSV